MSPGEQFKLILQQETPLQIAGTVNAYCALLAKHAGFKAIYLSGAGVANASHGLPDTGITTLHDVMEDVRRITGACSLPLLVDIDTGWGHEQNIARAIKGLSQAGAAAVHIEDQVFQKRCGHLKDKSLVDESEMVMRIRAAVWAKPEKDFVIMARTDAFASEGMKGAIKRARAYVSAGCDMIFIEALNTLEQYREFTQAVSVPVLANMTEFGVSPLYHRDELAEAGVAMILYPQSAFRAMSQAALNVYCAIRTEGHQKSMLGSMQSRELLYKTLRYDAGLNNLYDDQKEND